MKISIIIPILNEEKLLPVLLNQLISYTKNKDNEIIIVDGGSRDSSVKIAESYPVRIISSSVHNRAAQMNIGAQAALGEVFYFLHADAMPPSDFIEDILNQIRIGVRLGGYRLSMKNKQNTLFAINSFFTGLNLLIFQGGGDQSIFILKEKFESLNGFDESYVIMEDFDFIRRARKKGLRHCIINKSIQVSDRKYKSNSYLKVQLANLLAFSAFSLGISPVKIKSMYGALLKVE